jgi:hypothetical protein
MVQAKKERKGNIHLLADKPAIVWLKEKGSGVGSGVFSQNRFKDLIKPLLDQIDPGAHDVLAVDFDLNVPTLGK